MEKGLLIWGSFEISVISREELISLLIGLWKHELEAEPMLSYGS